MALVIDIDSHFEPGRDWLKAFPQLAGRLPKLDPALLAVETIAGDLLRDVPRTQWPPIDALRPPGLEVLFEREQAGEAARRAAFEGKDQFPVADAAARVKWLDQQQIDLEHVICLSGIAYERFVDDIELGRATIRACNTWLAETCAAARGRLLPVTAGDYRDLDWAVAELTRMRELGSRIFLIPAAPVNGQALCHPDWDRLWSAATDLGMVAMIHVGLAPARFFPGWANTGGDVTLLRQLGSSQRHQGPQIALYALTYGGVFERHPTLTVALAEVGTGWLPWFMHEIDERVDPVAELFVGPWRYPLKPSEYVARNVRATPLSGGSDQPLPLIMEQLPADMMVFSSDFPHFEGYTDPLGYYATHLKGLSPQRLERFYGGSIADVYARMGDPLAAPERQLSAGG